jgi:hypothetical protein
MGTGCVNLTRHPHEISNYAAIDICRLMQSRFQQTALQKEIPNRTWLATEKHSYHQSRNIPQPINKEGSKTKINSTTTSNFR